MNEAIEELNPAVVTLVAAFLPLALALINRHAWATEVKALVTFGLSIGVGCLVAWFSGIRTFDGFAVTCSAIYALSQAAYFGVYRPTGAAEKVEEASG